MSASNRPARPGPERGAGDGAQAGRMMEADTRIIGVSKRIWAAFAVLVVALVVTSFFLLRGQGEVAALREALREARSEAKEKSLALEHALADKKDLMKELSTQTERLAEYSRGEEKARSQLEQVSTGAEKAEKQIEKLRARLAKTEKALASEREERKRLEEEVLALQTALDGTRAELETAKAELERLRTTTTPYAPEPQQAQ